MLDAIFWVAIGTFVGWNIKRPAWSVLLQNKVVSLFTKK